MPSDSNAAPPISWMVELVNWTPMAIGNRKTVWILGAGFSRPLGGPLLQTLFRQQSLEDFGDLIPRNLAVSVVWSQVVFNYGKGEGLWDDAEEFLAFVDAAYGVEKEDPHNPLKRAKFETLLRRLDYQTAGDVLDPNWSGLSRLHVTASSLDPTKSVRRALAFETSSFLKYAKPSEDETWLPYQQWAKTLQPELDSVVTFNYDTVPEMLGGAMKVMVPSTDENQAEPPDCVPVFKLHGSVDWLTDRHFMLCVRRPDSLYQDTGGAVPAIAAPGRSKAYVATGTFKPLWQAAERRLKQAAEVAIIGYSFPKTDALALKTILDSLTEENCGVQVRQAHLVLGPDTLSIGNQRVVELLRYRMGQQRRVLDRADEWNEIPVARRRPVGVVNQHRLWAQDFIGDYSYRTQGNLP